LAHLPSDDPLVYKLLTEADTIGVFQVESRAQMATLPRLRPASFYDLVVQVAIIRPGPIVGQMVHPYLNRRAGREPVSYPHPSLEPILARTLGVPLFQEQLLRIAMVAAGFTGGQAEELRRAFGFKRSERRMKLVEVQLRDGMARQGITGAAAEQIILAITSFALYGFPESHAASFALLAYASAYLKVHYPAAFYTALLNNQPMGFYHPATLVKDAQRRGVRFQPIDVQVSDWDCSVAVDGSIRLGLRYVSGLREEVGRRIAAGGNSAKWLARHLTGEVESLRSRPSDSEVAPASGGGAPREVKNGPQGRSVLDTRESNSSSTSGMGVEPQGRSVLNMRENNGSSASGMGVGPHAINRCPKCGSDDPSMLEHIGASRWFCNTCSHDWNETGSPARFHSVDHLIALTGLRRDEVVTLANIGALNAFGYDRRSALWQAERAVRPSGDLLEEDEPSPLDGSLSCPLRPMTEGERLVADYAGTGLTTGRHPMALGRPDLAMRGVVRAVDLGHTSHGRRVRVAGMVITRQRPGTAKGFVFLTLEDETGVANIIVRPDLFARARLTVLESAFLLVDGILQSQDGAMSVRAESVHSLPGLDVEFGAHDFY
jgi:error-prone DNA polymerase